MTKKFPCHNFLGVNWNIYMHARNPHISLLCTKYGMKYIGFLTQRWVVHYLPGLTSIHRKCWSNNSMQQQKSMSYLSIHQVDGKNACHTIFIHFRKTIFVICVEIKSLPESNFKFLRYSILSVFFSVFSHV